MAYKKPQMVAKSSARKSYVAGCPAKTLERTWYFNCSTCEISGK